MKNTSFAKDFRASLELLAPYAVLVAVAMAAITSTGSWAVFFDKSFPRSLGIMVVLWVLLGAYFTSLRRRGGVVAGACVEDDDDGMSFLDVNPATGMPMMDGGVDVHGNPYGVDLDNNH